MKDLDRSARFAVSFVLEKNEKTPVTVQKGAHKTPVWIQRAWEDGEFATYIRNNGCGHCCCAMALRLCGIPDVTPYDEYVHCRTLWGPPDEAKGQYHFLSVYGALRSLRSYGVTAEAYGVAPNGVCEAVDHIVESLARGCLVIFDSAPLREDNPFSPGSHYVLLVGLADSGEVVVANSSNRARTPTLGIQTVGREALEQALDPKGCNPKTHDLTWGVLCPYEEKIGYIVIDPEGKRA